ncbi:YkgJ family cysteine cluster protein [Halobaculum sp. MBLA0143]|uniref:YkgJ family cysteine cluster protein n=1 Tax=Halobaculum sp. MBLA0143 TaxID=3079933 RepID=UPI00352428CC
MESLESELERARELDTAALAASIREIGFECTRCGACCKAEADDPHTATVFPDEVREIQAAAAGMDSPDGTGDTDGTDDAGNTDGASDAGDTGDADDTAESYDWRDVARPMPYGISEGEDGPSGETFEWALATDDCGDCTFYEEAADGTGACTVHDDRPLVCQTYPFSVALGGTSQPMGEAVDEDGLVRAHECEGLGRDISDSEARELAEALKRRTVREIEEAIAVRDEYEPTDADGVVVHDSEGAKRADGTPLSE